MGMNESPHAGILLQRYFVQFVRHVAFGPVFVLIAAEYAVGIADVRQFQFQKVGRFRFQGVSISKAPENGSDSRLYSSGKVVEAIRNPLWVHGTTLTYQFRKLYYHGSWLCRGSHVSNPNGSRLTHKMQISENEGNRRFALPEVIV